MLALGQFPMILAGGAVNWAHPINRDLVAWYLTLPGRAGSRWVDLVAAARPLVRSGTLWRGPSRPGGWGALEFDDAALDTAIVEIAAVTAMPLTLACWFRTDDDAIAEVAMALTDKDVAAHSHSLQLDGDVAGDFLRARSVAGGTSAGAVTSTGFTINTWHHAAAVFTSATDRAAYIDGGSKGTNTTSRTPAGLDSTNIGCRVQSGSPIAFFSGRLDDCRVYKRALSDAEVYQLYTLSRQGYPGVLNRGPRRWGKLGGTVFTLNASGTLTSAAALVRQPQPRFPGSLAPAGALRREARTVSAGSLTPAGALAAVKLAILAVAGALTSAGALIRQAALVPSGTLTMAGSLLREAQPRLAGTLTSAATLIRQAQTRLAGTLTTSGVLGTVKVAVLAIAGTLTSAGALLRVPMLVRGGSLAPSGTLVREVRTRLTATLTSAASLATVLIAGAAPAFLVLQRLFGRAGAAGPAEGTSRSATPTGTGQSAGPVDPSGLGGG